MQWSGKLPGADELLCPLSGGQECDLELGESTLSLLVWNITYRVSKGYKQKETPFHELATATTARPARQLTKKQDQKIKRSGGASKKWLPPARVTRGGQENLPLYSEKLL